jgi:glycerate kinase
MSCDPAGFEVVAEAIDLRARILKADIVITGEGKLDRQTLDGKAPAGVARMARFEGKPVFAFVGRATNDTEVRDLFDAVIVLNDASDSYQDTPRLLESHARALAARLEQ